MTKIGYSKDKLRRYLETSRYWLAVDQSKNGLESSYVIKLPESLKEHIIYEDWVWRCSGCSVVGSKGTNHKASYFYFWAKDYLYYPLKQSQFKLLYYLYKCDLA